MAQAGRDQNRVPTLIGVSSVDLDTPTRAVVDPVTNRLFVDALITTGDIQIGAVEIKNATDDTRATVGANGLYVDVKTSPLTTGPNVGQTTSNATAQQFNGGSSIPSTNGILVQAMAANTNNVYIGGSGVTSSNGYELQPGQAVSFTVDNISDLYVIGGSGSDKVCWNVL